MKSVLEEIYYGERGNCENLELSEGYKAANSKYGELMEMLEKNLDEEQRLKLKEIFYASAEAENEAALTHFKEGFKLGMQIALEVLT